MKGAIFDVDGTILDSMNVWFDAMKDFFGRFGKTFDYELSYKLKDMRLEDSLPYLIDLWSLDTTPKIAFEAMTKYMENQYKNSIPAKPYVCEYIKLLKEKGIKIAVATSGYLELCQSAFKRLGIDEYIDAYAFSSEVNCDKSNPDVYLLAAKRIDIDPEDCWVFEDIAMGINGAKRGGFKTCAVYDDTNIDETQSLQLSADLYIKSWSELLPD